MADKSTFTIEKITTETRERKDGKGTFETVEVMTTVGKLFSGYMKDLGDVKEGDTVEITSQHIKKKDNTGFNKIISVELSTESKPAVKATKAKEYTPKATTQQPTSTSTYNPKGARTGGVLHDAVAIAVHNASIDGGKVNLSEVEAIAESLLGVAERLEN